MHYVKRWDTDISHPYTQKKKDTPSNDFTEYISLAL